MKIHLKRFGKSPDASLVKELVSNDKLEKKIVFPTVAKINFVRPQQQEKPVRRPVKYAEMYRSQTPRGNQRNWNNQKSQQLGSDFVIYNKACFVCGSFDHVQANYNYHQKERMVSGNNYTRVNYNSSDKKAHPSVHKNIVPRVVLMKTGLRPLNTARPVNTAHPKTIIFNARPMSHFSKLAQSTVKRPYQMRTTLTNKNFSQKVNTTKGKFYTARPKAVNTARPNTTVVNAVRENQATCPISHDFKEFDGDNVTFRGRSHGEEELLVKEPHKNWKTCFEDEATLDESMLLHRRLENLVDKKEKIIRCDNGMEFKNRVMSEFCEKKGIKREFSVARTPQQNGVAERRNRTLIEAARTMLADSKLPTIFWAEVVNTACYVQNRVLVVKPHNKTPYELFRGRTPSLSFMKPFGKAFRVYNIRTRKVEENLHVRFLEDKPIITGDGPKWLFNIDVLTKSMNYVPVVSGTTSNDFVGTKESIDAGHSSKEPGSSQDYILMPLWKDVSLFDSSSKDVSKEEPQPFNDAEKKDDEGGINDQKGLKYSYCSTFFGDESEFFSDESELDLSNIAITYSVPTTSNTRIHKMDVKSAFLYGKIEEEVYVCQTPGFEDPEFHDKVYKVEKALYGPHQAPRAWYETLSTYLLDNRFQRGQIDKTLFIKRIKSDILLVQVYVDDIIFGPTKKELCNDFEKLMHKKFQMSSMGELTFFLGLQVIHKHDGILISQDKYVEEILKKFGFSTVKTASTPMETSKPLPKDAKAKYVDVHLYRSMIGSLMYLTASRPEIMFAVCACARFQVTPKVSHLHAVKRIFRYLKGQPKLGLWYPKDSPFDWEAYTDSDYAGASLDRKSITGEYVAAASCCGQVLWIQNQMLDYRYNFMNTKIFIDNESTICIVKNPVFHSKTKHIEIRHHFIRDSNENKLIQMIKLIQNQMLDYGYNFMNTKIFIDNESTICIVKNPVFHSKTKHIEIRHHFIRDSNENKLIQMIKIHTNYNVADLLIKAFDAGRFQYLIASIGRLNL
ncbi:putative ribonuclease H-like domain-containing protein [Tanacetum coccineum]